MVTSICVVACTLALGQPLDRAEWLLAPQLAPGMELIYLGTYTEEALVPNVQYQRTYRLETILFVMEQAGRKNDVAFMTTLGLRDAQRNKAPPGKDSPSKDSPSSVRLELATIDAQGRVRGTPDVSLLVPIAGPPSIECGCLVEAPLAKMSRHQFWEVNEEGRPPRTWQVAGLEVCNGVTCIKLLGSQQSDDWEQPRADRTAWRRKDTLWLSPQIGVAQRVERVIERRDPARRDPTHRSTVRYDLESRLKYPGRLFEDRRNEILKAKRFYDDARPLLAQPALYRQQIDPFARKISLYLDSQAPTPYRKAILCLVSRLDSARRGDTSGEVGGEDPLPKGAVAIGHKVPDFVTTDLTGKDSARLSRFLGRPVLVFFYNPTTETGKDVLRFARNLAAKHGNNLGIMAMAVTGDVELVRKQHIDLQLPFPILDGRGLHLTFGVDATPRLVLIDGAGVVRLAGTGWGFQVSQEITKELNRCLLK